MLPRERAALVTCERLSRGDATWPPALAVCRTDGVGECLLLQLRTDRLCDLDLWAIFVQTVRLVMGGVRSEN